MLVELPAIDFCNGIRPQSLAHVHGVRHGGYSAGIGQLELIDKLDNAAKFLDHAIEFLRPDLETGQVSDLRDVLAGEFHRVWLNGCLNGDWSKCEAGRDFPAGKSYTAVAESDPRR